MLLCAGVCHVAAADMLWTLGIAYGGTFPTVLVDDVRSAPSPRGSNSAPDGGGREPPAAYANVVPVLLYGPFPYH